jgi:hypothetical protein
MGMMGQGQMPMQMGVQVPVNSGPLNNQLQLQQQQQQLAQVGRGRETGTSPHPYPLPHCVVAPSGDGLGDVYIHYTAFGCVGNPRVDAQCLFRCRSSTVHLPGVI